MNRRRAMLIKQLYSIPYHIEYNLNGGNMASENPISYTIENSDFVLKAPQREGYTFLGWTLNDNSNYVFKSDFGDYGDKIYTANWKMNVTVDDDISSNINNLTIKTDEDKNNDGVADNYVISFSGSSSYERINLPIDNLIIGQKYLLSFNESNNAMSGNTSGYYPAMYGCIVADKKNSSIAGSLKETARSQGGLIAEWVDGEGGSLSITEGKTLNGPRQMSVEFIATAEQMYWIWDYGLIQDGIFYTFNYSNIEVKPVVPQINFNQMKLIDTDQYLATFKIKEYDERNLIFTYEFDGNSGCEVLYYPITNLTPGSTYSITFNHNYSGGFINGNNGTYEYGCGILSSVENINLSGKMGNVSSNWISNLWTMNIISNSTETVTLTFTPSSSTVYWAWNMANVSDSLLATIKLDVEKIKATHKNGGSIDYL